MTRLPIVTFHSLDDSGSVISFPPDRFGTLLDRLTRDGWAVCGLGEALQRVRARDGEGTHPPGRPLALTFDDAYANLREHALPELTARGLGATVFAIAGRLGSDNGWPGQPASIPRLPLLDEAGLRELSAAGWEIGSHGLTHFPLDRLDDEDLRREIEGSRAELEGRLDVPVPWLAYPYGAASERVRAAARLHYRAAVGTRLDFATPDRPGSDAFALPRIDAYYLRGPVGTRLLKGAGARLLLPLRRWARGLRR